MEKQEKIVYFIQFNCISCALLHRVPMRSFDLVQQEIVQQL